MIEARQAMKTDEELMLEFQRGSAGAFEELFGRYREPIYGYFRRRLYDSARAEELAQDTFVAVLRAAKRYEPRALFRTYLYAIAFKLLAAAKRKSAPIKDEVAELTAPGNDPDDSIWVRSAVSRLEAIDREVLLLREYDQLSYAEIAVVLVVPVNTVRSRLFRARMALKQLLVSQTGAS